MIRPLYVALLISAGCMLWGCSSETQNPVSSDSPTLGNYKALHKTVPTPTNVKAIVNGFSAIITWDVVAVANSYHVLVTFNGNPYVSDTLTAAQLALTNLPAGNYSVTVAVIVSGKPEGSASPAVSFTVSNVVAPTVTVTASPILLCPRHGKWVTVTFSGVVTNSEGGASYELKDEYNKIHYTGTVSAGQYSVNLKLEDRRKGFDKDGRQYTFTITATNSAGSATASVVVTVPREKKPRDWNNDDDDNGNDDWGDH